MPGPLKLSQIPAAGTNFGPGDQVVGVRSGPTDNLFSYAQIFGTQRTLLFADLDVYVNGTTGSDTTGAGTLANPWATPQHAYDIVNAFYDTGGWFVFVHIAAGSYTGLNLWAGATADGFYQFQGVNGDRTQVTIGVGSTWAVTTGDDISPRTYLSDLTLQNGIGLQFGQADVRFGTLDSGRGSGKNTIQGVSGDMCIRINGPSQFIDVSTDTLIDCSGSPNIRGFLDIDGGGRAVFQSLKTITGTPAMSDAFFKISGNSSVEYNNATITGTATGKRFIAQSASLLRTFGAAETTIPGDTFGTIAAGAVFNIAAGNTRSQFDAISLGPPVTITADHTVGVGEAWIINNKAAATCTLTLLSAANYIGVIFRVTNYQAQTVVSASSNVVPLGGGAAGTAILAATIGKWATLVSDGTNWIIMQAN